MVQASDDSGLTQMVAAEVLRVWTHFSVGSQRDFLIEQMRGWGTGGARVLPRFLAFIGTRRTAERFGGRAEVQFCTR